MNDLLASLKSGQYIEIFQKVSQGSTLKEACDEAGISTKTFNTWLSTQDGSASVKVWADVQRNSFKDALTRITSTQLLGINKLITALEESTNHQEIITILNTLDKYRVMFEAQANLGSAISNNNDREASEYLKKMSLTGFAREPGVTKVTQTIVVEMKEEEQKPIVIEGDVS